LDADRVLNPQRRLITNDMKYEYYSGADDTIWKSSCFHGTEADSWWKAEFEYGEFPVYEVEIFMMQHQEDLAYGAKVYVDDQLCGVVNKDDA